MGINGIIYCIENNTNGKVYIGQTIKSLDDRIKKHKENAKYGSPYKIHRAFRKYKDMSCYVLNDYYADTKLKLRNILNKAERYYIDIYDSYNSGYNMTKGGDGNLGIKFTDERKEKIRLSNLGLKRSEETKQNMRKPKSDNHRMQLSIAQTGLKHPESQKNRRIRVKCIDTGKEYKSITEASIKTGINKALIAKVVKGDIRIASGTKWIRLEGLCQ